MGSDYYLEKKPEKDAKIKALTASLLIDGTGADPIKEGVVIVDGDKIVEVGSKDKIRIPSEAQKARALLVAATKNGAECIGIEDNVGTLTKGKVANIIAVDGNPLEDIQAVKRVAYVMKDGSTFLHT